MPSTSSSAFVTCMTQAAQVMPVTGIVTRSVVSTFIGGYLLSARA